MKKISLVLLCGVILLGVCGCGNDKKAKDVNGNSISIKDFVGTWEIEGNDEITLSNNETYKLKNFTISEMVSTDYCAGSGCPQNSEFYYNIDNKLYTTLGNIITKDMESEFLCVQLQDKNTLKQVSCDILKDVKGGPFSSLEDFGITYKKKSNEVDETLSEYIFELQEKKTNEIDNNNNKPNNNNSGNTNNNNTSNNNTSNNNTSNNNISNNNEDNNPKVLKKYNIKSVEVVDKIVDGLGVNCRVDSADVSDVSLVERYGNKTIDIKYNATMTPIEYQKEEYKEQFPFPYCSYTIDIYDNSNKRYFSFNATTEKVSGLGNSSKVNHWFSYEYEDVYSSLSNDIYIKIRAN